MPQFDITAPDGKTYRVNAPDGTTKDQAMVYFQSNWKGGQSKPKNDFADVQGSVSDTVRDFNPSQRVTRKTVQQRKSKIDQFGEGFAAPVADLLLGASQITGIGSDKWRRETADRIEASRETPIGMSGNIAGEIGTFALPGGAIAKAAKGAKYARGAMIGGNALLGAAQGGLRGVHDGETRLGNTALGGAGGAAGGASGVALGGISSRAAKAVEPQVRALAKRAQELGIPVYASQVTKSLPVKVAASASKYLPFGGATKAAERQQAGFNRAIAKTFGSDADTLSDDVMQAAGKRIGAGYDDIYSRNDIPLTKNALDRLVKANNAGLANMTNDQGAVLSRQLDRIIGEVDATGAISGKKYQALRTQLLKAESQGGVLGDSIKTLRSALDAVADESVGGADAAALKTLRSQWANYKLTQKALQQVAGSGGDVKPSALWPLIRNGSTKDMRELARIGQQVLKDPIADSGTAQRNLLYQMMTGGVASGAALSGALPLAAKGVAAGALIGRTANSNALANYILRSNPGALTDQASRYLPAAVMPLPAAAQRKRK